MCKFLLWIFVALLPTILPAQITTLSGQESETFQTLNQWSKLKQVSNGNTFLIQIDRWSDFSITLFDPQGKILSRKPVNFKTLNTNSSKTYFLDMVEMEGQLSIFLVQEIKRSETLFRASFDINTGALITDIVVLEMLPSAVGAYFSERSSEVGSPFISMYFDVLTGYYAAACFTPYAETNERIELYHFNPQHQEINHSFFEVADAKLKYVDLLGLFVKGGEYVLVVNNIYDTFFSGGKKSVIAISKLPVGQKTFSHTQLFSDEYFVFMKSMMRYDQNSGNVYGVLNMMTKHIASASTYYTFLMRIQPDSLKAEFIDLPYKKINTAYFSKTRKFLNGLGFPHNFALTSSGNPLLLLHQATNTTGSLSNILLTSVDVNKKEYATMIPCNYPYLDGNIRFIYDDNGHNKYNRPIKAGLSIKSPDTRFFQINLYATKKYNYLVMNTDGKNLNQPENKKAKKSKQLSDLELIIYKYTDQFTPLEKMVLNKKRKDKINQRTFNVQSADFDPVTNKYCVLLLEKTVLTPEGKMNYNAKVVWHQFE